MPAAPFSEKFCVCFSKQPLWFFLLERDLHEKTCQEGSVGKVVGEISAESFILAKRKYGEDIISTIWIRLLYGTNIKRAAFCI